MKQIQGNLIELAQLGKFDVIIHGCNCFCTMGGGIAKQIKAAFPKAYEADLKTIKGNKSKLGKYSVAKVGNLYIINAYTQYDFRGTGIKVDYEAVKNVFISIKEQYGGLRIAYPKIGAGLAGGDWSIISVIIDQALANEDHTLVLYSS